DERGGGWTLRSLSGDGPCIPFALVQIGTENPRVVDEGPGLLLRRGSPSHNPGDDHLASNGVLHTRDIPEHRRRLDSSKSSETSFRFDRLIRNTATPAFLPAPFSEVGYE